MKTRSDILYKQLFAHPENVVAILFRLLRSRTDAEMRAAIGKGRVEGLRLALQVPADISQKIAEAGADQLLSWIRALAQGRSPQQLFAAG